MENFFQWRQEWLLGIREIDDQHRTLVEGIDKLARLYMNGIGTPNGNGVSRVKLIGLLNLLYGDIEQHFRDEEKRMLDSGYPGYKSHTHAHVMFLAELKNYFHRITTRNEELDMGTLYSLKTWFITHLLDDREFASYFHDAEAGDRMNTQGGRGE